MVIVPFSTDTLNTEMFSRRDGFPDVWLQVRTSSEFHAQLSSSPNGKGTLMLPHVRTQLSSVKVAKAKAIGRKHNTAAFIFMFLQSVLPLGSPLTGFYNPTFADADAPAAAKSVSTLERVSWVF
ncbi:hypothetical protein NL676_025423 [Syzygium grande]|nr:hypothetical protein NL676_025423 [Syzygium grande]